MDIQPIIEGIKQRDRRALSRGITLIESDQSDHAEYAAQILDALIQERNGSIRVGITGTPGVGKSTFIEALGGYLAKDIGLKVAVLAIDPTSTRSGGSILGDKTRMASLSAMDNVFIRPSPSKGTLGGVAAATMESIYLLEAADFDVILVETVGVGQSETAVHGMVDFFLLLLQPGSGDQLQGIKRGVVEMADGIVVNKADGDLLGQAKESAREYTMAVQLMPMVREDWRTKVLHCSALENKNIDAVWKMVNEFYQQRKHAGYIDSNRVAQELDWFDYSLKEGLIQKLRKSSQFTQRKDEVITKIKEGTLSPFQASRIMLEETKL